MRLTSYLQKPAALSVSEEQYLLERLYRLGDTINRRLKKARSIPHAKVVSLGNITTGGTGKTPAVQYFAALLKTEGYKVGILSRGYGGRAMKTGALLSDGQQIFLPESESGDEPYLLAVNLPGIPVAVGRNRFASAQKLQQQFGCDLFLLDDGFQHYALSRDVDIVLIDATNPFGNGHLLPNGILREPKESLKRSDIVILTKCDLAGRARVEQLRDEVKEISGHSAVFLANHRPTALVKLPVVYSSAAIGSWKKEKLDYLKGKEVWALSAIGNARAFENTLRELGATHVEGISFRDHHDYSEKDVLNILRRIDPNDVVVTTEKDWVKLQKYAEKLKKIKKFFFLKIEFTIVENEILLKEGLKAKILAGKRDQ